MPGASWSSSSSTTPSLTMHSDRPITRISSRVTRSVRSSGDRRGEAGGVAAGMRGGVEGSAGRDGAGSRADRGGAGPRATDLAAIRAARGIACRAPRRLPARVEI
ncbi:hypothetical protein GIY62_07945 [Burkholderia plantarii]|nr:hypothetical protein GIY62_07945 [Burkholderia plantarii]